MVSTHKSTLTPVASGAGRLVCTCGWKSSVNDDGHGGDSNYRSIGDINNEFDRHLQEVSPLSKSRVYSVNLNDINNFNKFRAREDFKRSLIAEIQRIWSVYLTTHPDMTIAKIAERLSEKPEDIYGYITGDIPLTLNIVAELWLAMEHGPAIQTKPRE